MFQSCNFCSCSSSSSLLLFYFWHQSPDLVLRVVSVSDCFRWIAHLARFLFVWPQTKESPLINVLFIETAPSGASFRTHLNLSFMVYVKLQRLKSSCPHMLPCELDVFVHFMTQMGLQGNMSANINKVWESSRKGDQITNPLGLSATRDNRRIC